MRRTFSNVFALALFLPLTAHAQQWSAEQQEVWDALAACTDAQGEEFIACFHDDFTGWFFGNGVPLNKADRRAGGIRSFETYEPVWHYLKPLSIDVRGDVAIVLYVGYFVSRNRATGEETSSTTNWTDIMVRDGGRWLWLADHGTAVEPN
jgi:hypothetical protein